MLIRTLHHHERPAFAAHLKRLSAEDRRLRFARSGIDDEAVDRYVDGIAFGDLILGVWSGDDLVGAAHVALQGEVAEVGVSVDAAHRADGIGSRLMGRAADYARNRMVGRLYTLCLSENRSMVALARRNGMTVHFEGGEAEAYMELPPPDPVTVAEEFGAGLFAVFHDWAAMMDSCSSLLVNAGTAELPAAKSA